MDAERSFSLAAMRRQKSPRSESLGLEICSNGSILENAGLSGYRQVEIMPVDPRRYSF
jgi:hypothetical protein